MVLSVTIQELNDRVRKLPRVQQATGPKIRQKFHPTDVRRQLREGSSSFSLTEDEERRLRRVFNALDIRKDGRVETDELRTCLLGFGMDLSELECSELLWEAQDYPDKFDLSALRATYARGRSFPEEPRRLFNFILFMMLDENQNGSVSPDEVFDYLFPKVDRRTLDKCMSRLFPKHVDPSGRITAAAFVRTLQSRLWTGTVHKVADQRHTRPEIAVPKRFVDAKEKVLIARAKAAGLQSFRSSAAAASALTTTAIRASGQLQGQTAELGGAGNREGILELLSVFKGRATGEGTQNGPGNWSEFAKSDTLMELRTLREYAERHEVSLGLVEKLVNMFKIYDSDQSGFIDKLEFRKLLMHVRKVSDVEEADYERAWREYGSGITAGDALMSMDDFIEWHKAEIRRNKNLVTIRR